MMRKCSMCGEYKEESSCYRYMNHLGRYNAYCRKCEQLKGRVLRVKLDY